MFYNKRDLYFLKIAKVTKWIPHIVGPHFEDVVDEIYYQYEVGGFFAVKEKYGSNFILISDGRTVKPELSGTWEDEYFAVTATNLVDIDFYKENKKVFFTKKELIKKENYIKEHFFELITNSNKRNGLTDQENIDFLKKNYPDYLAKLQAENKNISKGIEK